MNTTTEHIDTSSSAPARRACRPVSPAAAPAGDVPDPRGARTVGDIWREAVRLAPALQPGEVRRPARHAVPGRRWCFPTRTSRRLPRGVRRAVRAAGRDRRAGRSAVRRRRRFRVDDRRPRATTPNNVVIATGTWQQPWTPEFAPQLDPSIYQLHSHDYRNPAQLKPGPALVVGASHSGADLALEAANAGHDTVLAGTIHGELPFDIEGKAARVMLADHVVRRDPGAHRADADGPQGAAARRGVAGDRCCG